MTVRYPPKESAETLYGFVASAGHRVARLTVRQRVDTALGEGESGNRGRATDQRDLDRFAFSNDEHPLRRVLPLFDEEAYRAASQYHCTLRAQYGFSARPNPRPLTTLAMRRRLIMPIVDEQVLAGTMQLPNRASQRLGVFMLALAVPGFLYRCVDRSAFT